MSRLLMNLPTNSNYIKHYIKMNRNLLYILSLSLLSACSWVAPEADKPNVVIVLTDDQGYGDVGFNGNQMINTPALDALAEEGVVFDRFYVSPVCAPTRASLLTGKYHLATGTSWVTHRKEVMRESETTLAEILKANGYKTACFGKWHNGAQYPHNPNGQGFDTFFGFSAGHWNNYFDTELEYNGTKVQTQGYITDVLTDSVTQYIKNTDEPFLAYVAYNTPHTPYQVEDKYYDYYKAKGLDPKTAAIYGMVENIDNNVQRILDTLVKAEKYENTIFIFLSDNGPNFVRYNAGFKGRKAQVHEGGVRVPFIFNYPKARLKARHITEAFGTHLDILPTILDYCSVDFKDLGIDGISLQKIISNPKVIVEDRAFYSHHIMSTDAFCGAVRTNEYLLTCYPNDTSLYNLLKDPYQIRDIKKQNLLIVDSLVHNYQNWYSQVTEKGLEPEAIQLGHEQVFSVEFPAHEAKLYGALKFAGGAGWANDWVLNYTSKEDSMTWKVKSIKKTTYEAIVKYACNKKDIGKTLELSCGTVHKQQHISVLAKGEVIPNQDRVVRVEVDQRNWGELSFGEIELSEGMMTLCLSLPEIGASNIQIKELVLTAIHKDNE